MFGCQLSLNRHDDILFGGAAMRIFNWLTGRRSGMKQPSVTSQEVREIDGTPFVVTESDGMLMLMDRDTLDYQQTTSNMPDPVQQDLDELFSNTTRVRVLSGGMFRGSAVESAVLLDTTEADTLGAFQYCCRIAEGVGTGHCACLGGPTVELLAEDKPVATIGVQHGEAIRWARWGQDASLLDNEGLTTWLVTNGVDPTLLDVLYHNPLAFTGGKIEGMGPDPLSPIEQRVLLADIRYRSGNIDAARADCDVLLAEYPELTKAYTIRADIRMQQGEFESSVADFSAAISRGHRSPYILYARAVALDELGRTSEAIEDCTQAIALDPSYPQAYNSRAIIRMKVGQVEECLADFAQAIELDPDWDVPYVNRAAFALMCSDLAAAVADYDRAIPIIEARNSPADHPMLAKLYSNRSKVRRELGDRLGASADWRKAVRLDPTLDRS